MCTDFLLGGLEEIGGGRRRCVLHIVAPPPRVVVVIFDGLQYRKVSMFSILKDCAVASYTNDDPRMSPRNGDLMYELFVHLWSHCCS